MTTKAITLDQFVIAKKNQQNSDCNSQPYRYPELYLEIYNEVCRILAALECRRGKN